MGAAAHLEWDSWRGRAAARRGFVKEGRRGAASRPARPIAQQLLPYAYAMQASKNETSGFGDRAGVCGGSYL
jgi:hypothetical protein